jgi:hypothetical protein
MQYTGRLFSGLCLGLVVAAASPFSFGPAKQANRQAKGQVGGVTFSPDHAELVRIGTTKSGSTHTLRFWKGDDRLPDMEITLYVTLGDKEPKGMTLSTKEKNVSAVHVARKGEGNAVPVTEIIDKDFEATVTFTDGDGVKQAGKILLKTSDSKLTSLDGNFTARRQAL